MKLNSLFSYFLIFSFFVSVGVLSSCAGTSETATTEKTTTEETTTPEAVDANLEAPNKFATIDEMVENIGLYTADEDQKTFEKNSDNNVIIYPPVPASADDTEIAKVVKSSFITMVMRTFIHTDLQEVKVKVIPRKATANPEDAKPMEDKVQEASVSRATAEGVAKEHAGADLNSLVGNKIGELFRADMTNENMEKLTSDEHLDTVFSALAGK